MAISEIVDVQISIEDTAVSQAGFGVGLIIGTSNKITGKTQEFASAEAAAEVFSTGDPELTMINQYFGQELKPERVIVGDRDTDVQEEQKIIITTLADTTLYSVAISVDGVSYGTASYTSDGSATREEIVDGLIADIATLGAPVTTTDNGDDFDIESDVAGDPLTLTLSANLSSQTVTENVNISTELAEIQESNDEWYCLLSASHTDKDIKRAAAFIQARRKIYITASSNSDIISPEKAVYTLDFDADFVTGNTIDLDIDGIAVAQTTFSSDQATTIAALAANIQLHVKVATATVTDTRQVTITAEEFDVLLTIENIVVASGASQANGAATLVTDPTSDLGSELAALNYDRTALMYSATANTQYPEAAWAGLLLPEDPGSITWFAKTLAGVTADSLTSSQKSKALGNNVNTYTVVGGVSLTQNGTMASGRFIDIRRGVDWLQARMEENIFSRIVNSKKIPYTNAGIALIEDVMRFVLNDAVGNGVLRADPPPTITVPLVENISTNDRANRLLPDMNFTAELAGAVHKVEVRGTVSV